MNTLIGISYLTADPDGGPLQGSLSRQGGGVTKTILVPIHLEGPDIVAYIERTTGDFVFKFKYL